MSRKILLIAVVVAASVCVAQEAAQPKPEVKVHMLNVCTPSSDEQHELAAALANIPKKPTFSEDFEVDRGRSVLDPSAVPVAVAGQAAGEPAVADFVRMRREIGGAGAYSTVQYSFSRDSGQMVETLVFRVREPKDLLQVSIEDSASAVTSASAMLESATPASRIKLERFGKSSVVLARCFASQAGPAPDQSTYEPLFTSASTVLSDYRGLLQARGLIPEELSRIRRSSAAPERAEKRSTSKHP